MLAKPSLRGAASEYVPDKAAAAKATSSAQETNEGQGGSKAGELQRRGIRRGTSEEHHPPMAGLMEYPRYMLGTVIWIMKVDIPAGIPACIV